MFFSRFIQVNIRDTSKAIQISDYNLNNFFHTIPTAITDNNETITNPKLQAHVITILL